MLEDRPKFNFLRVLAGVLLVVLLVGAGFMIYRAGFTHGAVSGGTGDLDFFQYNQFPHTSYHFTPFSHFFFPGGFLFGLLFLFLIVGLFRRAFFRPRWGMHRMSPGNWEERAAKWHTDQHARMDNQPAPPTDDSSDFTEV